MCCTFRACVHFVSICYVIPDFFGSFLRCFRRFVVFFELIFHFNLFSRKEGMKSWLEWYFLGQAKQKGVYTRYFFFIAYRSQSLAGCFNSESWVAFFVRIRHNMLLLNTDEESNIWSVHDNSFISPGLWEVNHVSSCISGINWLYFECINCIKQILLTYNYSVPVAKNNSVFIEALNWIDGRVRWSQDLKDQARTTVFWKNTAEPPLRWFLSFALRISTAHDIRVISARIWARARTKRRGFPSK